jgi:hypothetical protein
MLLNMRQNLEVCSYCSEQLSDKGWKTSGARHLPKLVGSSSNPEIIIFITVYTHVKIEKFTLQIKSLYFFNFFFNFGHILAYIFSIRLKREYIRYFVSFELRSLLVLSYLFDNNLMCSKFKLPLREKSLPDLETRVVQLGSLDILTEWKVKL